jgi:hypothetical protein
MSPPRNHPSRSASYYRDQAKHARERAAAAMPDTEMRTSWLVIAESYEKLAEDAETADALGAVATMPAANS